MKPSKFVYRLWNKKDNRYYAFDDEIRTIPRNDNVWEIELWSGLTDCKGSRVFVGDLIKFDDALFEFCQSSNFSFYLKEKNVSFKKTRIILIDSLHKKINGVIVGNIHENQDLILN